MSPEAAALPVPGSAARNWWLPGLKAWPPCRLWTLGTPAPALSETGALPSGVTFIDNGNGTATLAGTAPASTTISTYNIVIAATNGVGLGAQQSFTLTVIPPPSFVVTNTNDSGAGSLLQALLSSASVGGIITFSPAAFNAGNSAAANTITLTSATLTMPSKTAIIGATSGRGATPANLLR